MAVNAWSVATVMRRMKSSIEFEIGCLALNGYPFDSEWSAGASARERVRLMHV